MSYKKNAGVLVSLIVAIAEICRADIASARRLLQSILDEHAESRIPKVATFDSLEGDFRSASTDEIRSLLPFAQKFLKSPMPEVRRWGVSLFLLVALNRYQDGSQLIEPYVDGDLAPLLDEHEEGLKRTTIFVLGSTPPAALPKSLAHLAAHLNDKGNSREAAGSIAGRF
jgi:hypothetical protein